MIGLIDVATVNTRHGTTGAYTVESTATLKCRVCHLAAGAADVSEERQEQAARRMLLFDPSYIMPDYAQVVIGTEKWNVVQGTAIAPRGPSGTVIFRRCEIVRAS